MYKRVLIKLSGEALAGDKTSGILDPNSLSNIAQVIKEIAELGTQVCVVIGAGNICRGSIMEGSGIERVTGDKMGMLGTIINSFALANSLQNIQQNAVVLSAIPLGDFAEEYSEKLADKYLQEGRVVVFGGGTGKPFFTTDTCATLRAIQTKCDAILIGKNNVDGIYSDNPLTNPEAYMFKEITCSEILARGLKVMDASAVEMLKDQDIDVRVFNMAHPENFLKVAKMEDIGTIIKRG